MSGICRTGLARQRGVALIMTLVVVALGSVMGLAMIERTSQSVSRTHVLMDQAKVDVLTHGMVLLAQKRLSEWQALQDQGLPSLDLRQWTPPYPVPGGSVQGRLMDLSGRFNLNALLHPDPVERAFARSVFERLLRGLNLDPSLTSDLMTWLASRESVGVSATVRPSPVGLVHVSELREWPGHQPALEATLWPLLSVQPTPELRVNVNEASPALLEALLSPLDPSQVERLLLDRPFVDLPSLWAHPMLQAWNASEAQRSSLATQSMWYLAQARVMLDAADGGVPQSHDVFRLLSASGASSGYDFRYVSDGIP